MKLSDSGKKLLHTPEGLRDIYGEELEIKRMVTEKIRSEMHLYGYEDIQTPTFEFFDVFSKEIGTTPSRELYKFFDKDGSTLALRPDFTPSCARCAAKYYMDEKEPIRFCYEGNAYTNTSSLQGKQRESTQMGVELIGDDSAFADAETIALLINSLQSAGLADFRISIGNAGYFRGICENAGIDEETEFSLREFISGKNFFAAEKLLEESGAGREVSRNLLGITELIGSQDALERAEEYADNETSMAAVKRLRDVYEVLGQYGLEKFVSFDLSMLSKYNYYTGIIFKGFTYGVGDVIATGGRYDDLIGRFGKNSPAVGFMIPVDALLEAMRRQKINVELPEKATVIKYNEEDYKKKLKKAQELRSEGKSVRMMPE